jgi:hypothetical protein
MESMSTLNIFSLKLLNLAGFFYVKKRSIRFWIQWRARKNNVLDPDLTRINVLNPYSQHCLSKHSMEAIRVYCFMIFTRHLTLFSESFEVFLFCRGGGGGGGGVSWSIAPFSCILHFQKVHMYILDCKK